MKENVKETEQRDLRHLWNQSAVIASTTTMLNSKSNFLPTQNQNIAEIIGISKAKFDKHFSTIKKTLVNRGNQEIAYYENEINRVKHLNREEAISELLIRMKLDSKINTIRQFIDVIQK